MDKRYLIKRLPGERWSSMKFPREVVNEAEMGLWHRAIAHVLTHGSAQAGLGAFKVDGHKLWEWRIVETRGRLYIGKTGTKLKCLHTSDGAVTNTFIPVVQAGCKVHLLPWRRAHRVR